MEIPLMKIRFYAESYLLQYTYTGVPSLQDLMSDNLRWGWCNNTGNKVHNKCKALKSSQTIPHQACPWKNSLPRKTDPWCQKAGGYCPTVFPYYRWSFLPPLLEGWVWHCKEQQRSGHLKVKKQNGDTIFILADFVNLPQLKMVPCFRKGILHTWMNLGFSPEGFVLLSKRGIITLSNKIVL